MPTLRLVDLLREAAAARAADHRFGQGVAAGGAVGGVVHVRGRSSFLPHAHASLDE